MNKYWEFFFDIHENNINSVTGQPIFLLHSTFAQFEHVVKLSVDNRQLGVFDLHVMWAEDTNIIDSVYIFLVSIFVVNFV